MILVYSIHNLKIDWHFFYKKKHEFNDPLIENYFSFQNPLVITYCLSAS